MVNSLVFFKANLVSFALNFYKLIIMKTRLLLFLLLATSFTNAQQQAAFVFGLQTTNLTTSSVTFSYTLRTNGSFTNCSVWYSQSSNWSLPVVGITPSAGFSHALTNQNGTVTVGGLQPNTTYFWRVVANNNSGNANSGTVSFTTLPTPTAPTISAVSPSVISTAAVISYALNANSAATTSIINFGLTSGALTSQVAGFSATGNTATAASTPIPNLLASTQYFYQIVATNSVGTTLSTTDSFTTTATPAPGAPIAEYNFNNTYNNINGNSAFSSNNGTTFVTGRDGVTVNGALNINNTGSTATIPGLPYGASPRTIAFWAKTLVMDSSYNMTFSYGQSSGSSANGGSFNATKVEYFGFGNNLEANSTNLNNTWYFFTYTYDGLYAKIYKNGTLLNTLARTWNTTNNNNIFKLGIGVSNEFLFKGAIDDLIIYNYAVTDADVTSLFNNNSLSASNFQSNNLKFNLSPNPATDILNISMESELKSVEIYSLLGQKVFTSDKNQVDVSSLSKGMYMVRVEDVNNGVSMQKLVIE